jgi:hypothetical protein
MTFVNPYSALPFPSRPSAGSSINSWITLIADAVAVHIKLVVKLFIASKLHQHIMQNYASFWNLNDKVDIALEPLPPQYLEATLKAPEQPLDVLSGSFLTLWKAFFLEAYRGMVGAAECCPWGIHSIC